MDKVTAIIKYYRAKGWPIDPDFNIVYFEGADEDLRPNGDADNRWNDQCIIWNPNGGITFQATATTEPNKVGAQRPESKRLGGVFRIAIGFHSECWCLSFHKTREHFALVQCAPIMGHRDRNADGFRTGDAVGVGKGINQHGTAPGFTGETVGTHSLGCLVRKFWENHLEFMRQCFKWACDQPEGLNTKFSSAVIDTTDFHKWRSNA